MLSVYDMAFVILKVVTYGERNGDPRHSPWKCVCLRIEWIECIARGLKVAQEATQKRRKFRKISFHQGGRLPRSGHCIELSQWSVGKSQIAGQSEWVDRRTEVMKKMSCLQGVRKVWLF